MFPHGSLKSDAKKKQKLKLMTVSYKLILQLHVRAIAV